VPADAAFARIKSSRKLDEFESDLRLQRRVRENYLRIAKQKKFKVVNGAREVSEVQAEIRKLVRTAL
jgi:thymidylate kinase